MSGLLSNGKATKEPQSLIGELIAQVQEAAQRPLPHGPVRNRPFITVGVGDPIVLAFLFDLDFDRYFNDPVYYFTETLRQKLWRAEHIRDDNPVTVELPAWLGLYPEYTFIGMAVTVNAGGVAMLQENHPLTRRPDLSLLSPVDFHASGWMPRILRWYEYLTKLADGRIPVTFNMTWWRGCLDLAVQLRGYEALMTDVIERPTFVHALMRFLAEQRCRWYEAYWKHFGLSRSFSNIGDDWLNVPFITPEFFATFVLPRYLEIEQFHGGITWVHSCGNQAPLQPYLLQIRSLPGFEVSPWTDLRETLRNIPPEKGLGIALHPTDVFTNKQEAARAKLMDIKEACAGRNYSITAAASPLTASKEGYVDCLRRWLDLAYEVFDSGAARDTPQNGKTGG